jgi:glutamine---fructose-6-phosphate transaminase (isomerizing)
VSGPDRAEQFVADIAASPDSLERLLDAPMAAAARLRGLGRVRIALAGLGSSRYAALTVASALRSGGGTAWAEYASSTAGTAPAGDLVFVAISASGRTREVVEAAERHRGRSLVVAVTNDPESSLAGVADLVVPLLAGEERAGIACRTFRATVAALAVLTGTAPDAVRPAVAALATRIERRDDWLPTLVDGLDATPSIDVLADATLLGLAEQAALMLREAPRLPATAYDSGDWLHTGVYLALPGHRVLRFPGAAADAEVTATVERRGGRVLDVVREGGSPIVRALVESVVAELVAAELWRRASAEDTPG